MSLSFSGGVSRIEVKSTSRAPLDSHIILFFTHLKKWK